MNVLMLGWEYPPLITGGLGTACHGLSRSLAPKVSRITFVLPRIKGSIDSDGVNVIGASDFKTDAQAAFPGSAIDVLTVNSALRPYLDDLEYQMTLSRLTTPGQPEEPAKGLFELSGDYGANLISEVLRYAAVTGLIAVSTPCDIIHAHDWMTFPAGIEAKRRTGKPLVVHVHALEFDRSGDNINQCIYDIEKQGMHAADHIIAVSMRTRDMIISRYGIDPARVTVIHNGIVPLEQQYSMPRKFPGEKLCVFLGRITMQKGPEYFLEAAYQVCRVVPNVRFVMAGCGDMMTRMIARAAELRLTDRFFFTGFLDEERRGQLFSMADLFVMTSVSEPFGLTPVEAIQYDVPVIVTRQAGVSEVLNHAVKVDFWDIRRIADAMIKVLQEPALSRQMVEGSRSDLAGITWEKAAEIVHNIYQELM